MKKDIFIYEYEQPNVIEDHEQFLKIMKELELFEDNGIMKTKNYLLDCKVGVEINYCDYILSIYVFVK